MAQSKHGARWAQYDNLLALKRNREAVEVRKFHFKTTQVSCYTKTDFYFRERLAQKGDISLACARKLPKRCSVKKPCGDGEPCFKCSKNGAGKFSKTVKCAISPSRAMNIAEIKQNFFISNLADFLRESV